MDLSCECDCDCEGWADRIIWREGYVSGVGPTEYEVLICPECWDRCVEGRRRSQHANPWRILK